MIPPAHTPEFTRLLSLHIARDRERRRAIRPIAGDRKWWLDADAGALVIGTARYPAQYLGSESWDTQDWTWAWSNHAGLPPALLADAGRCRELGVKLNIRAFSRPAFPRKDIPAAYLAAIACGLAGGDGWYAGITNTRRGPGPATGIGVNYFVIHDPALRKEDRSPKNIIATFSAVVQVDPVDERATWIAYLTAKGYTIENHDDSAGFLSRGTSPEGGLVVGRFDAQGRAINLAAPGDRPRPPPDDTARSTVLARVRDYIAEKLAWEESEESYGDISDEKFRATHDRILAAHATHNARANRAGLSVQHPSQFRNVTVSDTCCFINHDRAIVVTRHRSQDRTNLNEFILKPEDGTWRIDQRRAVYQDGDAPITVGV